MMAGNLAVMNDIKNAPNKIILQCNSKLDGEEIINQLIEAKFGHTLHLQRTFLQ